MTNPHAPVAPSRSVSGHILNECHLPGLRITENLYRKGLRLRRHSHQNAYFTVVLGGTYMQAERGQGQFTPPRGVRFLPAGESHFNEFAGSARCLQVELCPAILEKARSHGRVIDTPRELTGWFARSLATRFQEEFRQRDNLAPLALEAFTMELLVEASRDDNPSGTLPAWLQTVREFLHTRFLDRIRLADLSALVDRHPVHVSREFRRYFRCSLSGYIRKLRVDCSVQLMNHAEVSLAQVALMSGFSEQSHFCRAFKEVTGHSPADYRKTVVLR